MAYYLPKSLQEHPEKVTKEMNLYRSNPSSLFDLMFWWLP